MVQIFDSWAGILNDGDFDRWSVAPTAEIVAALAAGGPGRPRHRLSQGRRTEARALSARKTGVDAVGIDWTVPLDYARERLQPHGAVQGNLDPIVLLAGGEALDRAIDAILDGLSGGRFIFNLGHGILPETPIAHVERLVARVRGTR